MNTKIIIFLFTLVLYSNQARTFNDPQLNQRISQLSQNQKDALEIIFNIYERTDYYDESNVENLAQTLTLIIEFQLYSIEQQNLWDDKKQFFDSINRAFFQYNQKQINQEELVKRILSIKQLQNMFTDFSVYLTLVDNLNKVAQDQNLSAEEKDNQQEQIFSQHRETPEFLEIFLYSLLQSEYNIKINFEAQKTKKQNTQVKQQDLLVQLNEILDSESTQNQDDKINKYLQNIRKISEQYKDQNQELIFILQEQFYEILKKLNHENKMLASSMIKEILEILYQNKQKKRVLEFLSMAFAKLGGDGQYCDKYLQILKNNIQENNFDFEQDQQNISKYLIFDYFRFVNIHQEHDLSNEKLSKLLQIIQDIINLPQKSQQSNLSSQIIARVNILTEDNLLLMHQILNLALQFRNQDVEQDIKSFDTFLEDQPNEKIKEIYVPTKLIITSLLAGQNVDITFNGSKMPQNDLYKDVLLNENGIEQVLLQLYAMKNRYILNQYDPAVYKRFLKDQTFNLSTLDLEKPLVKKPMLIFNDDERGMFSNQKDFLQTTDNLVKVVAGNSEQILEQKILNENEQNAIIQFIEENGIQEYSDEENEYENVYVIVKNAKSPCFKKL